MAAGHADPLLRLEESLRLDGHPCRAFPRRSTEGLPDVEIIAERPKSADYIARFASGLPWVARANAAAGKVAIRMEDSFICALVEGLRAGTPLLAPTSLPSWSWGYVIEYVSSNANKGLHIGHARNACEGSSIAAALRYAGAAVETQMHLNDVGYSVLEALPAFRRHYASAASLPGKGDILVGRCYREGVRSRPEVGLGFIDAPIAAEIQQASPSVRRLAELVMENDSPTIQLLRRMTDAALSGQLETLSRIGERLDRTLRESDRIAEATRFAAELLSQGVLCATEGFVVFQPDPSNKEHRLVLRTPNGFMTEHLRGWIGILLLMSRDARHFIHVAGNEWQAAVPLYIDLMRKSGHSRLVDRTSFVLHGLVKDTGHKVKSSGTPNESEALLLDQVLGALDEAIGERSPASASDHVFMRRTILWGYFLSHGLHQHINYSLERLLDPSVNPGWELLRAAMPSDRGALTAAPNPADTVARYAALQALRFRRIAVEAAREKNPRIVLRFLLQLLGGAPEEAHAHPAFRAVLRAGLACIGLDTGDEGAAG